MGLTRDITIFRHLLTTKKQQSVDEVTLGEYQSFFCSQLGDAGKNVRDSDNILLETRGCVFRRHFRAGPDSFRAEGYLGVTEIARRVVGCSS